MRLGFRGPLCNQAGDAGVGEAGAGAASEQPKADGRTERFVIDDLAKIKTDVERLKKHTALDALLESKDESADASEDEFGDFCEGLGLFGESENGSNKAASEDAR